MGSSKRLVATVRSEEDEVETSPSKRLQQVDDNDNEEDDEEERLRRQLNVSKKQKEILHIFETKEDELVNPASDSLDKVGTALEKTFKDVLDIRTACVDANLLTRFSEKITRQTANIGQSKQKLTGSVLSSKLFESFPVAEATKEIDFARLGNQVQVFFRSIPRHDCMLGPIDLKLAPKKEKVKREKKATVEYKVEKPKEMRSTAAAGGENAENVLIDNSKNMFRLHENLQKELFTKLRGKVENVPVFDAVMDPKSFTQTVENLFALTFLVKDACAWIKIDDDVPTVTPIAKNNEAKHGQEIPPDTQFIAAFSYDDWQHICQEFDIQKGLLEHRDMDIYDDDVK